MGKSEQRVRSDRINALKHQYDAFLEEDKKRRERNEYILGKLDKMRLSTAIVLRNRLTQVVIDPHSKAYDQHIYDDRTRAPVQSILPVRSYSSCRLDDNDILKEITKKYILIPKQTHFFETEEVHKHGTAMYFDSSDWKSKYDILTKLKQDEKETGLKAFTSSENKVDSIVKPAPEYRNYDDIPERDFKLIPEAENDQHSQENLNNISEAVATEMKNEIFHEINKTSININNYETAVTTSDISNNEISETKSHHNYYSDKPNSVGNEDDLSREYKKDTKDNVIYANVSKKITSDNDEDRHICDLNYGQPNLEYAQRPLSGYDINISEKSQNEEDLQIVKHGNNYITGNCVPVEADNNTENTSHDEIARYPANVDLLITEATNESAIIATFNENNILIQAQQCHDQSEYPTEKIKMEEYRPDQDVDVAIDGLTNFNPLGYDGEVVVNEENKEGDVPYPIQNISMPEEVPSTVDESQINEFDEENKQMFYTEEHDVNYQQYTNDEYVSNAEQPVPAGAYDENGQYVYFEDSAQNRPYPVEYEENQASMQPYDQTYEQQYGGNSHEQQQYDQSQYNQQPYHQQAVEQPHIYENVEQYSEQPNTNTDDIQQQLDADQGYTEPVLVSNNDGNDIASDFALTPVEVNSADANVNPVDVNLSSADENVYPVNSNEKTTDNTHTPVDTDTVHTG